jgi:adenine-specific DNA-methyltransferase
MPTLHWIGKEKVINHHRDVPFKVLEHKYGFDNGIQSNNPTNSGNLIIHGDNLEALKALLPQYEGKVDCICIDPPYNTGNEKWVYNDNVNHPKIKKWLGEVVGKDGEDLSRHDKWLCMMYPRLKLLQRLLSERGAIFISIDDNAQAFLKLICDEIFGPQNFLGNIVRATGTTTGQDTNGLGKAFDYIVAYSKSNKFIVGGLSLSSEDEKRYNLRDEKGLFSILQLRRTGGEDRREDRPTMYFPVIAPDGTEVFPIGPTGYESRWRVGPDTVIKMQQNNELYFKKDKSGAWKVYYKYYLENRTKRPSNFWYDIEGNKKAQIDIKLIFEDKVFDTPKPIELIDRVLQISTNKNSIVLDSFSGSGTTAHALLNLNKKDGGNRKFICIEMEDYAETVTAERVKRVIKGYGSGTKKVEGTGGSFDFYELGLPIFVGDNKEYLNEEIDLEKIREYIWYSETRSPYIKPTNDDSVYFLGKKEETSYYFIYDKSAETTLDYDLLSEIKTKSQQYVIYADNCLLSKEFMMANNIVFKKIPRDVTRF